MSLYRVVMMFMFGVIVFVEWMALVVNLTKLTDDSIKNIDRVVRLICAFVVLFMLYMSTVYLKVVSEW